jgi:hypothetical protein
LSILKQHGQLRWSQLAARAQEPRGTLAGCRVVVHEHLDDTLSITFGPHVVGRYQTEAVEMTPPRKPTNSVASRSGLEESGQKAA